MFHLHSIKITYLITRSYFDLDGPVPRSSRQTVSVQTQDHKSVYFDIRSNLRFPGAIKQARPGSTRGNELGTCSP